MEKINWEDAKWSASVDNPWKAVIFYICNASSENTELCKRSW